MIKYKPIWLKEKDKPKSLAVEVRVKRASGQVEIYTRSGLIAKALDGLFEFDLKGLVVAQGDEVKLAVKIE